MSFAGYVSTLFCIPCKHWKCSKKGRITSRVELMRLFERRDLSYYKSYNHQIRSVYPHYPCIMLLFRLLCKVWFIASWFYKYKRYSSQRFPTCVQGILLSCALDCSFLLVVYFFASFWVFQQLISHTYTEMTKHTIWGNSSKTERERRAALYCFLWQALFKLCVNISYVCRFRWSVAMYFAPAMGVWDPLPTHMYA